MTEEKINSNEPSEIEMEVGELENEMIDLQEVREQPEQRYSSLFGEIKEDRFLSNVRKGYLFTSLVGGSALIATIVFGFMGMKVFSENQKNMISLSYEAQLVKKRTNHIQEISSQVITTGSTGSLKSELGQLAEQLRVIGKRDESGSYTSEWYDNIVNLENVIQKIGVSEQGRFELVDQSRKFKEDLYSAHSFTKQHYWRTLSRISTKMITEMEKEPIDFKRAQIVQQQLAAFIDVFEKSSLNEESKNELRLKARTLKNGLAPLLVMSRERTERIESVSPALKAVEAALDRTIEAISLDLETLDAKIDLMIKLSGGFGLLTLILLGLGVPAAFGQIRKQFRGQFNLLNQEIIRMGSSDEREATSEELFQGEFRDALQILESKDTELQASQMKNKLLIRGLRFPMALIDREDHILYSNDSWNEVPDFKQSSIWQKMKEVPSQEQACFRGILGNGENAIAAELWVSGMGGQSGGVSKWIVVQVRNLETEADLIADRISDGTEVFRKMLMAILAGKRVDSFTENRSPYPEIQDVQKRVQQLSGVLHRQKSHLMSMLKKISQEMNSQELRLEGDLSSDQRISKIIESMIASSAQMAELLDRVQNMEEAVERRNASSLKSLSKLKHHSQEVESLLNRYRSGFQKCREMVLEQSEESVQFGIERENLGGAFEEAKTLALKVAILASRDELTRTEAVRVSEQVRELMEIFWGIHTKLERGVDEMLGREKTLIQALNQIVPDALKTEDPLKEVINKNQELVFNFKTEIQKLNDEAGKDFDSHCMLREYLAAAEDDLEKMTKELSRSLTLQKESSSRRQNRIEKHDFVTGFLEGMIRDYEKSPWYLPIPRRAGNDSAVTQPDQKEARVPEVAPEVANTATSPDPKTTATGPTGNA